MRQLSSRVIVHQTLLLTHNFNNRSFINEGYDGQKRNIQLYVGGIRVLANYSMLSIEWNKRSEKLWSSWI